MVSPLLTRDSYELLRNCLSSKETDLWFSLGDAWSVPKEEWRRGSVPTYYPKFYNAVNFPSFIFEDKPTEKSIPAQDYPQQTYRPPPQQQNYYPSNTRQRDPSPNNYQRNVRIIIQLFTFDKFPNLPYRLFPQQIMLLLCKELNDISFNYHIEAYFSCIFVMVNSF